MHSTKLSIFFQKLQNDETLKQEFIDILQTTQFFQKLEKNEDIKHDLFNFIDDALNDNISPEELEAANSYHEHHEVFSKPHDVIPPSNIIGNDNSVYFKLDDSDNIAFPIQILDQDMIQIALKNPHLFQQNDKTSNNKITPEYLNLVSKYPRNIPDSKNSKDLSIIIDQLMSQFEQDSKIEADHIKLFLSDEDIAQPQQDNSIDSTIPHLQWIDETNMNKIRIETKNAGLKEKSDKLNHYLGSLQIKKPIVTIEDYSIFNELLDKTPNFHEVIKFMKGNFILNQSRAEAEECYYGVPTPILLLGDPGIGKTYFAKLLAKQLSTSFNFLDANSITATWVLTGSSGQWQSADAGFIFKCMLESKTVSPVVIFDEIDKLSSGKSYDPFSAFHQLLEPENSKDFKDEFLNAHFDASKIIYILTANNINNIPESLLSRMRVFDINQPSPEATRLIAQSIYSDIIGKSKLFNPILEESNLKKLESLSPRNIKKLLNHAVFIQASNETTEFGQQLNLNTDGEKNSRWGF
jgi:ATP-dependent Lon protease